MHTARLISSTLLAGLLGFGLASCDPRVFDDLADQAWVHSAGEPAEIDSVGFGLGLVAGGGDSLHYIVATEAPPAVVMVKFDRGGNPSTNAQQIRSTLSGAEALTGPVVMASDPGGFAASNGNVAVATFDGSDAALFMIRGENGAATPPFNLSGGAPVSGIAFGATDASASTDLVAVVGSELNVIADYQSQSDSNGAAQPCAFVGVGGGALIADVDPAAGDEVLFAVDGSIQIASAASLAAAADDDENCFDSTPALGSIEAPGGESSFGRLIIAADFDGNDELDLVVTAPAQRSVYVFMNYSTQAPGAGEKLASPANATQYGISAAAGDFDGDGRDELVVGDPAQRAEEHARAGIVYLYASDASGSFATPPLELHDASPENDQRFGQSLTVTRAFGGDNLVVGARNEVFTYFRTPVSGDDDFRN